MQMVVYTAITNNKDVLKEQPFAEKNKDVDFVAFMDSPVESKTWRVLPAYNYFSDPVRNAKHHKILPHLYFPFSDYSLWIDGSILIVSKLSMQELIDTYLKSSDLAVHVHAHRNCIYDEANAAGHLDNREVIRQQMDRYRKENYPAKNGLAECPVLLRRHTPATRQFDEGWWEEIANGSRRDQLSFNYVATKQGFKFTHFPSRIMSCSSADNPHFRNHRHK